MWAHGWRTEDLWLDTRYNTSSAASPRLAATKQVSFQGSSAEGSSSAAGGDRGGSLSRRRKIKACATAAVPVL